MERLRGWIEERPGGFRRGFTCSGNSTHLELRFRPRTLGAVDLLSQTKLEYVDGLE